MQRSLVASKYLYLEWHWCESTCGIRRLYYLEIFLWAAALEGLQWSTRRSI